TVLNAGANQTLSVSFTPTDAANYTGATATTTITVLKASATITWTAPADITYGTALSTTQLSATANVPGTFVYSPVAGTVLNAGANQTRPVRGPCAERRREPHAVVHLHADRRRQLHRRHGDDDHHRAEGEHDDQLVGAGGHYLRHRAERDVGVRDGERARQLRLLAGRGHRAERGRESDAVGDLHADRRRELPHCDEERFDQCAQGQHDDQLDGPGGHHLRDGAQFDAAECDRQRAGDVRLQPGRRHGAERRRDPDPVGDLHADRRRQLHHCDEERLDQR